MGQRSYLKRIKQHFELNENENTIIKVCMMAVLEGNL